MRRQNTIVHPFHAAYTQMIVIATIFLRWLWVYFMFIFELLI